VDFKLGNYQFPGKELRLEREQIQGILEVRQAGGFLRHAAAAEMPHQ